MNIHDLRESQARFANRIQDVLETKKELYQIRSAFVKYFSRKRIQRMDVDDYVLGVDHPKNGFNFCYGLERQLDGIGRILNSPAPKFGVYYGKRGKKSKVDYQFVKKFGDSYQEAFEGVREAILQLLVDGENQNSPGIVENNISPMFKGKILSTYFPERYLNIFSPEHLDYFLIQLDLDTEDLINEDTVYKREALLRFKNQDAVMKNWTVDLFTVFLYNEYPGTPPKTYPSFSTDPLANYTTPTFPPHPNPSFITLNILPPNSSSDSLAPKKPRGSGKPRDYEGEARELRKLGDRGEKIVMDLEQKRLREEGREDLAEQVDRVSLKSDSYGYDILSFESDGTERYIEVKATRSKVGNANFFYTAYELKTSGELKNYFIYMVYDVTSTSPKVWVIKNPFNPENNHLVKQPMNYRITINASKA